MMKTLAILLLMASLALPALAAPSDDPDQAAVAHIKKGIAQQAAGRHELAIVHFDQAWALRKHPKVLFYKARSLMVLERYEKACEVYRLLAAEKAALEADKIAEVSKNTDTCTKRTRRTRLKITTKGLVGAVVLVDGQRVGESPVQVERSWGDVTVEAVKDEFQPAKQVVKLRGQQELSVILVMKPVKTEVKKPPVVKAVDKKSAWPWVTLGSGIAMALAGGGFFGNYMYQNNRDLACNQRLEGGSTDLIMGSLFTGSGLVLGITSVVLFHQERKLGGEK